MRAGLDRAVSSYTVKSLRVVAVAGMTGLQLIQLWQAGDKRGRSKMVEQTRGLLVTLVIQAGRELFPGRYSILNRNQRRIIVAGSDGHCPVFNLVKDLREVAATWNVTMTGNSTPYCMYALCTHWEKWEQRKSKQQSDRCFSMREIVEQTVHE